MNDGSFRPIHKGGDRIRLRILPPGSKITERFLAPSLAINRNMKFIFIKQATPFLYQAYKDFLKDVEKALTETEVKELFGLDGMPMELEGRFMVEVARRAHTFKETCWFLIRGLGMPHI